MPATLQTREIAEGFPNFPQKTKRNASSITGSRASAEPKQPCRQDINAYEGGSRKNPDEEMRERTLFDMGKGND